MLVKLIVCLAGMPGAGKSTIAEGLKSRGYDVVNMGDAVREEAAKRALEPSRENLGKLMLELRREHGQGAVAELVRPKIESSAAEVVLVDGIRSIEEVQAIRKFGNVRLLAVHASTSSRFDFLQRRGRPDDPQTRDHFVERDSRELGVGISNPIALSDEAISNTGMTKDELVETAFGIIRGWI
ncbi:MAG: dephospho-CoA kinase [Nitrosopumilus sp. H8]|nr:MAG: dephospho-CoA kinase [Nitrosopumilus sp. H13]RNJ79741.1 MAG: dephospho-CoA kinase [Nitrosopumilus sp. H8]